MEAQVKIKFRGRIVSVQPRSNVWRYRLDNRTHSMTGYNIFLVCVAEDEERQFAVAISEKQQEKLRFHIGDEISGTAWTKKYAKWEYADYYRAGSLKKLSAAKVVDENSASPWTGEVPELSVYDWRGCECWTLELIKANVLLANGRVWQMLPLSMIGELVRSSVSRVFATDLKTVSCTKWASREPCRTKALPQVMMKAGLTIFVPRIGAKMIREG